MRKVKRYLTVFCVLAALCLNSTAAFAGAAQYVPAEYDDTVDCNNNNDDAYNTADYFDGSDDQNAGDYYNADDYWYNDWQDQDTQDLGQFTDVNYPGDTIYQEETCEQNDPTEYDISGQ